MNPINITDYFDETVLSCINEIAIVDQDRKTSFGELYQLVLSYAKQLHKLLKGQRHKIIGVYLPKSLEAVVADLAILYSGNVYMNLDVKNPADRLQAICQQTDPALIICGKQAFPVDVPCLTIAINDIPPLKQEDVPEIRGYRNSLIDTDLCCLINTSGSTGTPKSVALNHRGFIDFINATKDAQLIEKNYIIGSLSPIVFDIFSFELCLLMAEKATIVIIPETLASFPAKLLEFLEHNHVSYIFWVPTIMVNIANMNLLPSFNLQDLKMIWFAGEVFPTEKFNYWRRELRNAVFANFYGPIEISLDCLYYVASQELPPDTPIPIGKPFRNTAILVLDDNNQAVTEAETIGELCIRGSSLAMGYYNSPQRTADSFVQNPLNPYYPEIIYRTGDMVSRLPDGNWVYRGRKDTLIKHLGYRIELGEIEHVVVNSAKIAANCCAVYNAPEKKIVLFYEAPASIPEKDIRKILAQLLPKYMIPLTYIHLVEMPRNTNGKIDRLKLKNSLL